jgi:hypothetical protein
MYELYDMTVMGTRFLDFFWGDFWTSVLISLSFVVLVLSLGHRDITGFRFLFLFIFFPLFPTFLLSHFLFLFSFTNVIMDTN